MRQGVTGHIKYVDNRTVIFLTVSNLHQHLTQFKVFHQVEVGSVGRLESENGDSVAIGSQ